jgi:hypothetical protein
MAQYTTAQLQRALKTQRTIESYRSRIDTLTNKLSKILGGGSGIPSPFLAPKGKKKFSATSRARMAAAQKARWAKLNGKAIEPAKKGRRKMSAAAKAKISAAAKKRWAKVKAAGKSRL